MCLSTGEHIVHDVGGGGLWSGVVVVGGGIGDFRENIWNVNDENS